MASIFFMNFQRLLNNSEIVAPVKVAKSLTRNTIRLRSCVLFDTPVIRLEHKLWMLKVSTLRGNSRTGIEVGTLGNTQPIYSAAGGVLKAEWNKQVKSCSGGIMTATRFFVYGSMSEGMVHFSKIADFVMSSVPATIKATAYRLKVGFPALLQEERDCVAGHLVELRTSDLLQHLLDEFFGFNKLDPEKSVYSREKTLVEVEGSSEKMEAWVYFLNPKKLPPNAKLIEGGDWQKSLSEEPVLVNKLSERQVQYIQRLGKSTGREIVPIDLPLYRELMGLELIVDKGRRLALSKLGHEVYRHLG